MTSFFRNFQKVPEFPNFRNFRTFGKTSFRNYRTFSEISEIFPNFWTKKQGFFALKPQILHHFFWNFRNLRNFRIITELFSELKFPNFFPNFFAKILRVWKFRFFPKNFQTSKTEHFRNSRKRKVRKFPSNAGPYTPYVFQWIIE